MFLRFVRHNEEIKVKVGNLILFAGILFCSDIPSVASGFVKSETHLVAGMLRIGYRHY